LTSRRQLIVNADDFGFTHDVNEGIVEAHRDGILTATTLMANGAAFDDAVRLGLECPALDVGCHLVLVQGKSMLPPHRPLPSSLSELVRSLALGRISVYDELAAQVRRIVAAGIRPTHLDTHKHTHLLPPVMRVLARLSREFGIPWVRLPIPIPIVANGLRRIVKLHDCRATDHFAGFRMTGRYDAPALAAFIRSLPAGLTEFMCHPGKCTGELRSAATRLKDSRQLELEALTAEETRRALDESGVELVSYRGLA